MKKVYKWTICKPVVFRHIKSKTHNDYMLLKKDRTIIAYLDDYGLHIGNGYSWDGCSPKIEVGGVIYGVWDGYYSEKLKRHTAYNASLIHDVLLQMLEQNPNFPITRLRIDQFFRDQLIKDDFTYPNTYYFFVRLWSKFRRFQLFFKKRK